MARSAAEYQRKAVSFVTRLCVGALVLIAAVNGRCTKDCPCVRSSNVDNICCLTVSENQTPGTVIGNANDLPLVANATPAQYLLVGDNQLASRLFRVHIATGVITTAVSIDRENYSIGIEPPEGDCVPFNLDALESDGRSIDSGGAPIVFGIVILDENDNRPQFNVNYLNITVRENSRPGDFDCTSSAINNLQVTDDDIGTNGMVTYKVAEGTPGSELFEVVDPTLPCVDNLVPMDRENTSVSYSFVLVATDGGNPSLSSNITVRFNLTDVNDNAPMFLNDSRPLDVPENTEVDAIVGHFKAIDIDADMEPLTYHLMTATAPFRLNSSTGDLILTGPLDAESVAMQYELTITAEDKDQLSATLNVRILVTDVNEVAEVTPVVTVPDELWEEEINGVQIFLQIDDRDKTPENMVNTIEFVSGGEYFQAEELDPSDGISGFEITQIQEIDRESVANGVVLLSLLVIQQGNPNISVPFKHNFTILDINDNRPYLTRTHIQVQETNGNIENPREEVIQLNDIVRDDDNGENGTIASFILGYAGSGVLGNITDDFIASNALERSREIVEGELHLPSMLDREKYGNVLTVIMTFIDGGTTPMNRTDSFMIEILDVNDNAPVFRPLEYTFDPSENRNPSESIGTVNATDMDDSPIGNGRVVYTLERIGDYKYFSVGRDDGMIFSNNTFDREQNDTFVIYVSASDEGNPPRVANASAKVTIRIRDQNDEPPRFTSDNFMFIVETTANVGDFVGRVVAIDEDLDKASNPVFYKFLYPTPNFRMDNSSGRIELDRILSIADSPYNLTVVAFNPGAEDMGDTASVQVDIVQSSPIEIYAISAGAAGFLVLAIILLSCCICCLCRKSRNTGRYDTKNSYLNNTKPILKTLPATNGQQRSVKFNTTIEETHYDPTGIAEDSTIRKESNFGSGDESPQTSLRITMSNGMNGVHEPDGIMDYEMSPSIIGNGDLPHQRPSYSRHTRIPSPIMLQEELNTSEYSQSTLSAIDDRNTYNSEGEEVESTYSDAPSNYNTSIPRFGRQTIQVEDHRHPGSVGHYGSHPPSHQSLDLHSHLPPVQHSSPGHFVELRAHNLARHEAQFASSSHPPPQGVGGVPPADDIRELSLGSLPRNIGQHHHHGSIGSSHGSSPPQRHIQRQMPPTGIHQPPPVSLAHSIVTPTSNSHANTRNYPHPLVMPEAFPSAHSRVPAHRFDSFIPSFTDYGETSTYASTELNEALEFKYEAEPDFCSLTATDYGENDTEL